MVDFKNTTQLIIQILGINAILFCLIYSLYDFSSIPNIIYLVAFLSFLLGYYGVVILGIVLLNILYEKLIRKVLLVKPKVLFAHLGIYLCMFICLFIDPLDKMKDFL